MNIKESFSKPIKILLVTNATILTASAMLGPIYALFVEKIGGSLLDASYAFGLYALTAGIVTFVSGRYCDRIRENELIIVLGYVIVGIGFLSYTMVNSIISLFLVQILIGFGEAIYSPAFDAVYSKHLDHKKRGRGWGMWEAMNYFTMAFGAIVGGTAVYYFGFNFIFVIMSLMSFASAIYIFCLPRKLL